MEMKYHTLTRRIASTGKTSIPAACTFHSPSGFLAYSKKPWTLCVTAALVKPASAASHRPEGFIHKADAPSLWHSLCGTGTPFTPTPPAPIPFAKSHSFRGHPWPVSSDLSQQINKSRHVKLLRGQDWRFCWTALWCIRVCITSLQNKSIHFSVNKDKTVCRSAHTYLFLPWQWWVRPLLFVLFSPQRLYSECRGCFSQPQPLRVFRGLFY